MLLIRAKNNLSNIVHRVGSKVLLRGRGLVSQNLREPDQSREEKAGLQ